MNDGDSSTSSDWEVMGDAVADVDARAAVYAAPQQPGALQQHGNPHLLAAARHDMHAQLQLQTEQAARAAQKPRDSVPVFDTGEPQYAYGDGGGPPLSDDSKYQEVAGFDTGSSAGNSSSAKDSNGMSALVGM